MSFSTTGLAPALLDALAAQDIFEPTAIQAAAVPVALQGADLLASAPTGSGKTLAFGLPILQQLAGMKRTGAGSASRSPHALILAPTRELAGQIGEILQTLARSLASPVKTVTAFGGVSINPQMMALRGGADIVVATPGRLLDLVAHNALRLDALRVLVLDEADRLLDAGFAEELQRVIALLPARRQNLLFSATLPPAVQALADQILQSPVRIAEAADVPQIEQHVITVDAPARTALLQHLIREEQWQDILVFVATRHACDMLADKLTRRGIPAAALHGDLSQGARTAALDAFREGRLQVLVATDVAARGLDIAGLQVVINYDLPRAAPDYAHRIGRTGRAGEAGLAISFVSADTEAHFRLIEKRCGIRLEREFIEGFEPRETPRPGAGTGGIKGKRKSRKDKQREAAAAANPEASGED
ncbi:DEAD/DEAH box helicase [Uliginosibacterium paludis]|uniref:DEAD/DEAH box helicase n=1 Tax=Uliginosibacterium paludis TaxID=1615952 RepID=A0ABV2CR74_9RHOO